MSWQSLGHRTMICRHFWKIDEKNYGICEYCHAEKQMMGWYEYLDLLESKKRRIGGSKVKVRGKYKSKGYLHLIK